MRPFREGDRVLVEAVITRVENDDPYNPSVTVWIGSQAVTTDVLSLRRQPPTPTVPAHEFD